MKLSSSLLSLATGIFLLANSFTAAQDCPGPSVRKAWRDLTCVEQDQFLVAVTALKASGVYDEFVSLHFLNAATSHGTNAFFPWHRWYIWHFEKQLQQVSNSCVTLPYWDWERDYLDMASSPVLKPNTFGSTSGIVDSNEDSNERCVNEGIADYTAAPWDTTVRTGGCLKRVFNSGTGFSSDVEVLSRMTSRPAYSDFRPALEGAPHAAPHNYVGEHMSTHFSPDDPLFFLHHANVDRIWAIWEDYWGYDEVVLDSSYTNVHYPFGEIDVPLEYIGAERVDFKNGFLLPPTPRDMIRNFNGLVSVTYANDLLAQQLGYVNENNPDWVEIASGSVDTRCAASSPVAAPSTRRLNDPDGGSSPSFTNPVAQARWTELVESMPNSNATDILSILAEEDCNARGNPKSASESWIQMMGMGSTPDVFECHLY
jgi:tyrosinase